MSFSVLSKIELLLHFATSLLRHSKDLKQLIENEFADEEEGECVDSGCEGCPKEEEFEVSKEAPSLKKRKVDREAGDS